MVEPQPDLSEELEHLAFPMVQRVRAVKRVTAAYLSWGCQLLECTQMAGGNSAIKGSVPFAMTRALLRVVLEATISNPMVDVKT